MATYNIKLTFTEALLGGVPKNRELYTDYILSKAPQDGTIIDDELDTIPADTIEKGTTGFHTTEDGQPILYDYLIKGYLKDACGMLARAGEGGEGSTHSAKLKAYKKVIDGLVFVFPRRIPLVLPPGAALSIVERPLRAQTAQGERVALARSESAPAGTTLTFKVRILGALSEAILREWFDYGELRGLGQWRNSGVGRFTYTLDKPEPQ